MAKRRARADFPGWIEANVCLPLGTAAEPGPIKLPVYLREIAESFVAPGVERITVQKSARIGFSTLLSSLIAWHMTEQPAAIMVVLPAELDARNAVVALEELFACSPALTGRLPNPSLGRSDRNTILFRKGLVPGASLRAVGATAPRNLRAVSAKIILIDEADALQDSEGDVIALAEARSLTFKDRRTVIGGTPLLASTSRVARSFAESDMRIYECRCPSCRDYAELRWSHFHWEPGRPETIWWACPHCGVLHHETEKARMVREGRWRTLRPEAGPTHRGFRINCLVSALPHATWGKLAAQWEASEGDDERRKAFLNTLLGEPWAEECDEVDEEALAARAEEFGVDRIPAEVLALTVGIDIQSDRIEASIFGHGRDGTTYVLAHQTIWGDPLQDDTWQEVDELLKHRWRHPGGGMLKIDAAAIDSGGQAGVYDTVMKFANARLGRRVLACKGAAGWSRPVIVPSKTKKGRLFIIGVDGVKTQILSRLSRGQSIRFSHTLDVAYYEQLAAERRVVRFARGRPVARFELRPGVRRAEALDCLVLGLAARAAMALSSAAFDAREQELTTPLPPKPAPTVYRSQWMEGHR
jgi:phage terminase large subunit GpA-like protein